jgi:thiol:disulfide interchange protein DsbD
MRLVRVVLALVLATSGRAVAAEPVTATMRLDGAVAVVDVAIASGWHVNAHDPDDRFLVATTLTVTPPDGTTAGDVRYPAPVAKVLEFSEGKALKLYEGRIRLESTLAGAVVSPVRAKLRYQACDDTTCLPPKTIELTAEKPRAATAVPPLAKAGAGEVAEAIARKGWMATLLSIVLIGMALNLTPCVYPLISVTVAFFGGKTGRERGAWLRAIVYVAGICLSFAPLGAAAALTGMFFGKAMQQPAVLGAIAGLMALLALANFGLYQLRMPTGVMQWASRTGEGALGALFMGFTMGIVAAPCIGPFVSGLMIYVGTRQSVGEGLLLFMALGFGLGLPYLGLALFAERFRRLPRSGSWLEWMERLFGFMMLGLALHFATALLSPTVVRVAWTALFVVAGLVLGFVGHVRRPTYRQLRAAGGIALAVVGAWLMLAPDAGGIVWTDFSDDALASARAHGRPVLIDFQAVWCLPCREMERTTFRDPAVVQTARAFATLKADLSTEDDRTTSLMSRFNVPGVPTYVLLDGHGDEQKRFTGFVEAPELEEALRSVAGERDRG